MKHIKQLFFTLILCACSVSYSMDKLGKNLENLSIVKKKTKKVTVKQPEEQADTLKFPQVHFSPGIKDVLIKFISEEQEKLQGAWYRFTLYKAAQAIADGIKNRKMKATLIVDESNIQEDFCSPLQLIIQTGGKVYQKVSEKKRNGDKLGKFETLHHKFMIFHKNVGGKKLVWTGSFNATGQADLKNCENVVILDDEESIEKFEQEFNICLAYSSQLSEKECISAKDKTVDGKTNFARDMNDIPIPTEKSDTRFKYPLTSIMK